MLHFLRRLTRRFAEASTLMPAAYRGTAVPAFSTPFNTPFSTPIIAAAFAAITLTGCATRPVLPPLDAVMASDAWFSTSESTAAAVTADPFALSDDMRSWLASAVPQVPGHESHRRLVNALYRGGTLAIAYDAQRTRSASEAFEARAGNCLSLVIMTSAFAKPLGLEVQYQLVDNGSVWERNGDLDVRIGHVNIILVEPAARRASIDGHTTGLIVDFMPEPYRLGTRPSEIDEARVLAMYRTNRSVEALFEGRIDEAYAWVRAALRADERFVDAWNTLAVVTRRRGERPDAPPAQQIEAAVEAALRRALALDADYTPALNNLANLMKREGRVDEAAAMVARLQRVEPNRPLAALDDGMKALRAGDARGARRIFEHALQREPENHALHHGLAIALTQIGERGAAARELERARELSGTRTQQALYAAKLEWLRHAGSGSDRPGAPAYPSGAPLVN